MIIIFQKNREETMEEQKKTKEATITLDLTVEEFLFIQEKIHFPAHTTMEGMPGSAR